METLFVQSHFLNHKSNEVWPFPFLFQVSIAPLKQRKVAEESNKTARWIAENE